MNLNLVGVPVPLASPGTVTISLANPAVIGKVGHALVVNTPGNFTVSTGVGDVLPKPLVEGKQYYVAAGPNANDFGVSEFPGGPKIATLDAGQGTFAFNTEVMRIDCSDLVSLGVLLRNRGANALTALDTYVAMKSRHHYTSKDQVGRVGIITDVRTHNAAADYTTPLFPLVRASASPVTLASGATVLLMFNVSNIAMLSMRAIVGVAAGTLDVEAVGKSY